MGVAAVGVGRGKEGGRMRGDEGARGSGKVHDLRDTLRLR